MSVETNHRVILFYNMAFCFQRLDMISDCIEYLEMATKALKESLKRLTDEQAKLIASQSA